MAINWNKYFFVRRDRGTWMKAGIFAFAASLVLFYLHFSKEQIKSKDDITFITGPFKEYTWTDYGMRGASLTFKLQNYTNRFKIKADFFYFLPKDKLKSISYGDTLTVGIPNTFVKFLNKPKQLFFVYSIASGNVTYLDLRNTIEAHNTLGPLVAAIVFVLFGFYSIHLSRKAKPKTPVSDSQT
jgi:hypothetical protein